MLKIGNATALCDLISEVLNYFSTRLWGRAMFTIRMWLYGGNKESHEITGSAGLHPIISYVVTPPDKYWLWANGSLACHTLMTVRSEFHAASIWKYINVIYSRDSALKWVVFQIETLRNWKIFTRYHFMNKIEDHLIKRLWLWG